MLLMNKVSNLMIVIPVLMPETNRIIILNDIAPKIPQILFLLIKPKESVKTVFFRGRVIGRILF